MNPNLRRSRFPVPGKLLYSVLAAWLLTAPAAAQQPPEKAAALKLKIFPLKHENPDSLGEIILSLFGENVQLVSHHLTNSLIIQAAGDAELKSIEELIRQLDVEPPAVEQAPHPTAITRSYKFQNAKLDNNLGSNLGRVLGNYGQFAIDIPRNLVIYQTNPGNLESIEGVLSELDRNLKEVSGQKSAGKLIRTVWLLGGAPEGQLAQPPGDLAAVISELSLLGIERLGMVAQTVVQAVDGESFQTTSSPELDKNSCNLQISGQVLGKPDGMNELQIMISASLEAPSGRNPPRPKLVDISTKVLAPSGHHVVLCVSPVGDRTSVFVVQVRSVEE